MCLSSRMSVASGDDPHPFASHVAQRDHPVIVRIVILITVSSCTPNVQSINHSAHSSGAGGKVRRDYWRDGQDPTRAKVFLNLAVCIDDLGVRV